VKKGIFHYIITTIGTGLIVLGVFFLVKLAEPKGMMQVLPYISIGLGCGVCGHGIGGAIALKKMRKNPNLQKQMEIEQRDERNTAIAQRAKAKAFDWMLLVYAALLLAFSLLRVDMTAVLLFVLAYLLVIMVGIYYRFKYDNEM
jgi:hypothetical protein